MRMALLRENADVDAALKVIERHASLLNIGLAGRGLGLGQFVSVDPGVDNVCDFEKVTPRPTLPKHLKRLTGLGFG